MGTFVDMGDLSPARLLQEAAAASPTEALAYLVGATHDGTYSRSHRTTRFCQSHLLWLEVLRTLLSHIGYRSWNYREGARRNLWVLETSWRPPTVPITTSPAASRGYLRAYFDTDGGVPRDPDARFYIQYAQKGYADLSHARGLLEQEGISCGRMHNPSRAAAPDYWRFFVRSAFHMRFAREVSSWHPVKRPLLDRRLFGQPLQPVLGPSHSWSPD